MKKTLIILFLLCSHFSFSQCFHNLDFEYFYKTRKESKVSFPISWAIASTGRYIFGLDTLNKVNGKSSLLLKPIAGFPDTIQEASAFTRIDIKDFAKTDTIIVEFSVRIDSFQTGKITLFSNVFNIEKENFEGLSTDKISISGNTDSWKTYKLKLHNIENATHLQIGFDALATCYIWLDDIKVFFDGNKYEDELVIPDQSEVENLKKNVYPLEVEVKNISQNKIFDDFFKNVNVVGLGECTHGTSEIFTTKNKIIQYLVENQGFEIVVFEAAMAECEAINKYIQTGEGDIKDLLKGIYFWTWETQEVYDLISWMREYNLKNNNKLRFMGADMQYSKGAFNLLWEYAVKNDSKLTELLMPLNTNLAKVDSIEKSNESSILGNEIFKEVLSSTEKVHNYLFDLPKSRQTLLLLQYSELLLQYSEMNFKSTLYYRDSCMAQNVNWIYNYYNKKIVYWGHNGHIDNFKKHMGGQLKSYFSSSYKSIGFLAGAGTYTARGWLGLSVYTLYEPQKETYEYIFNQLNYPMFFLTAETISKTDPKLNFICKPRFYRDIGSMTSIYQFECGDVLNLFDGLIYIQNTSASKCFLRKE